MPAAYTVLGDLLFHCGQAFVMFVTLHGLKRRDLLCVCVIPHWWLGLAAVLDWRVRFLCEIIEGKFCPSWVRMWDPLVLHGVPNLGWTGDGIMPRL